MVAGDSRATQGDEDDVLGEAEHTIYQSAVGSLIYLSLDRTDIQFVAKLLASTISKPTKWCMQRLRRAAKYLLGTVHWVLLFP